MSTTYNKLYKHCLETGWRTMIKNICKQFFNIFWKSVYHCPPTCFRTMLIHIFLMFIFYKFCFNFLRTLIIYNYFKIKVKWTFKNKKISNNVSNIERKHITCELRIQCYFLAISTHHLNRAPGKHITRTTIVVWVTKCGSLVL